MNCPVCGTDNRDGARFCRRCGVTLTEAPVPPEPAAPEAPVEVEETVPTETLPEEEAQTPAETPPEANEQAPTEKPTEPEEQPPAETPPKAVAEETAPAPGPSAEEPFDHEEPSSGSDEVTPPLPPEQAEAPAEPETESVTEAEAVPDLDAFWREDVASLQPAPAGTVIDGRYALGEVLDMQDDHILYEARDLQRCWQCGFDGNAASEAFCSRCGAALERKPEVRVLEVRDAEAEAAATASGERVIASLVHDNHTFLVLAEPEPLPQPAEPSTGAVRLIAGQRSVPGQVRDLNEDSVLILTMSPVFQSQNSPSISLFAVADGMGGHEGGEIASKLALQVLAERIVDDIALPSLADEAISDDGMLDRLRQAVSGVNDAVYMARQKRGTDMGTTLTTLLVRDQQLFLAHVGDCRAFRWDANGLRQLTADHSLVASMVARGQITADEIYTHPQRSIVYRSIGDRPIIEVDTSVQTLAPGDRLIVCSDGLWEMVRNEGIQDGMMAESDPQAACDLLASRANAAGGDDNISVIVVQVVKA